MSCLLISRCRCMTRRASQGTPTASFGIDERYSRLPREGTLPCLQGSHRWQRRSSKGSGPTTIGVRGESLACLAGKHACMCLSRDARSGSVLTFPSRNRDRTSFCKVVVTPFGPVCGRRGDSMVTTPAFRIAAGM